MKYSYRQADEIIWLNTDDPDLVPIPINQIDLLNKTYREHGMPEPNRFPDFKDVHGYGKRPEEQFFEREVVPKKLVELERNLRASYGSDKKITVIRRELNTMNDFWKILEDNQEKYAEEIEWIRRMWYYRLLGKFYFINGKVTYLTGANWFFLNWWWLDRVLPDYRDRDRRWYLSQKHFQLDTTTFKNRDKKGKAIANDDGTYEMIDLGRRTCYGEASLKARRAGDTSKAECDMCEYVTRSIRAHCGIQGKDDKNAENVFYNHFVIPFQKLPMLFKPITTQLDPSASMVFNSDDPNFGLRSWIDFATSADKSAYDGEKLHRYHADESGKTNIDVSLRHRVVVNCMTEGDDIIGWAYYTTTVDEMNRKGGQNFLKIINASHWNQRNDNGSTASGLVIVFFRAGDGLKGFIGPHGESISGAPTAEQAAFTGKNYGADEHLDNVRKGIIAIGDWDGLSEQKRMFPQTFRECFTPPSKNTFFRNDILEKRVEELQFNTEEVRIGNFYWVSGPDSRVEFVDDPTGRWRLTVGLPATETNLRIMDGGNWFPERPNRFKAASDAFRLEKTEGGRMSNGGGAVYWERDTILDPDIKDGQPYDIMAWKSARFVCSYSSRPDTTYEYAEDMLMMSIYFGALMYPETNVNIVAEHFIKRGYGGYLLYDTDPETGKRKNNPGWYTTGDTKKDLFNGVRDYIARHGKRDMHADFLQECLLIKDLDDMTNWDLFTSCAGALRAARSKQGNYMEEANEEMDADSLFEENEY